MRVDDGSETQHRPGVHNGQADLNWLGEFAAPPTSFRPVAFWSWNETLEPAELRRQVDLFADGGWGGAFLHSRPGLLTPYLKDKWFEAIDAVLDQSRKRGLHVWLYDEDGWPSGVSGGAVTASNPEFRIKSLCARPIGVSPPAGCLPIGSPTGGLQVYSWVAPLGDWRYRGLCYTDVMSKPAVGKFIDEAYEPYHQKFSADYGSLIKGEFFDEPRVVEHFGLLPAGPVPFSTDLLEHFKALHGYDPTDKLHLLFDDGPGAAQLRLHYYRTTSDLFEENFVNQIATWCRKRQISLTGHFMGEGSLLSQQQMGVKIMPAARHMQIPGIDHLGMQVDERLTAKQCQSVVNQYGHPRMMSELFGAAGQNISFEDRLWIASQQLCFGVNLFVPHLALYTMVGPRKNDHPPNLFYQQPWWPMNRHLEDVISRTSVALSQGTYVAEALIIHPQESTFVAWKVGTQFDQPTELVRRQESQTITPGSREKVNALDSQLHGVMDVLLSSQRTFDLGDEQILADLGSVARIEGVPHLRVGRMHYPVVVLPGMVTMAPKTLELLVRFKAAGGTVLRCGQTPKLLDGVPSQRLDLWLADIPLVELPRLRAALDAVAPAAVKLRGPEKTSASLLHTHIRDLPDGSRLVYLANLSRIESIDGQFLFRGFWQSAQLLDAVSGSSSRLPARTDGDRLAVKLSFAPTQSRLILLSRQPDADQQQAPTKIIKIAEPLKVAHWQVQRLDDNAMVLDCARFREANGSWSERVPLIVISEFLRASQEARPIQLQHQFQVRDLRSDRKVFLVVQRAARYAISVNGRAVEYAGLPFVYDFRWLPIDITGLLHEGVNEIDLHCSDFTAADASDLSASYLSGDFAVIGQLAPARPISEKWRVQGLMPPMMTCLHDESLTLTDPLPLVQGDVTTQGLPFYAGRLKLTAQVPQGLWQLQLDAMDAAVAEVFVNGMPAGVLMQSPLTLALPQIVDDHAQIEIILYNTLRNLTGPHHHPEGDIVWVDPTAFAPSFSNSASRPTNLEALIRGQSAPSTWEASYLLRELWSLRRSMKRRWAIVWAFFCFLF